MLVVRQTEILRGPNIWTQAPVIQLVVDIGDLEDRPSNELPGFCDRLAELLPSLVDQAGADGRPGGLLQRLREGAGVGHVLERVALESQRLAGEQVAWGETRSTEERGVYDVVYEYRQEEVGLAAGELAIRLLDHLLFASEPGFDFVHQLHETVIPVVDRLAYPPSTGAIVAEAERRGIPIVRLDPYRPLVQLGHGKFQRRIWRSDSSETSHIAVKIAGNKELTNRLLREAGIPVPSSVAVRTAGQAVRAAEQIGYPVVLKPLDGNKGRGVCINLDNAAKVREFFPLAIRETGTGTVLVESYLPGNNNRILVVNKRVVAVVEKVPARVFGDGEHTIQQLVDITNADPRRNEGHQKIMSPIPIDVLTMDTLERQGLTLDDVPAAGRLVQLKLNGNTSTGGTSIDRTDDIHPDNVEIARQAAMVVGLDIAGVDLITPDVTQSARTGCGAIVEVNSQPGLRSHTYPTEGRPRNASGAIIDMLFPPGQPCRVPIVAVTGTNGKTTTCRMLAHILKTAGRTVGLTTGDGVYLDGVRIMAGDRSGQTGAEVVMKNPAVDSAVFETDHRGILRSGLEFDRCDVAVVTNVAGDDLGLGGVDTLADLARVTAVVPGAVLPDGATVLNADNCWTVEMARGARGEVVFFSMDGDNPVVRDHVRARGRAVVLRQTRSGEQIAVIDRKRERSLLRANQIPATFDGRLRVNVANALAAAAAAVAQDVPLDRIRHALRTFTSPEFQTAGRPNQLEVGGRRLVLDYCDSVAGLAATANFVRWLDTEGTTGPLQLGGSWVRDRLAGRLAAERLGGLRPLAKSRAGRETTRPNRRSRARRAIGLIAMPGDRSDGDVAAFGTLAGQTFDELIIREDAGTHGRQRGAVADLLRAAATAAGLAADKIAVVDDGLRAVDLAIEKGGKDDFVVLMADKPAAVWSTLSGGRVVEAAN